MTLVNIPGAYLPYPSPPQSGYAGDDPSLTWSSSFTRFDASGEGGGFVFQCPKSGNIDRIAVYVAYEISAGNLDFRLEDVDAASGEPSGTLADTNSNLSVSASVGWQEATLTGAATVTRGQLVWAGVKWVSGDIAIGFIAALHPPMGIMGIPYFTSNVSGSWAANSLDNRTFIIAVRYDDGTYAAIPNALPISAMADTDFNSADTPDEIGNIITMPFEARVCGAWVNSQVAAADYTIKLYDTNGSTVMESLAVDKDIGPSSTSAHHALMFHTFSNSEVLTKDSAYRITVVPGASDFGMPVMTVDSAALFDTMSGGQNCHYTSQTDSGGFSQTTTKRALIGLLLDQLDDGAGGGGGTGKIAGRGGGLAG